MYTCSRLRIILFVYRLLLRDKIQQRRYDFRPELGHWRDQPVTISELSTAEETNPAPNLPVSPFEEIGPDPNSILSPQREWNSEASNSQVPVRSSDRAAISSFEIVLSQTSGHGRTVTQSDLGDSEGKGLRRQNSQVTTNEVSLLGRRVLADKSGSNPKTAESGIQSFSKAYLPYWLYDQRRRNPQGGRNQSNSRRQV